MKICFLTLGTRGDVQPYLALAKKFISLGHEAVICTGESFKQLIEGEGVLYRKASLDLMAIANTADGKAVLEHPMKNLKLAQKMSKEIINPGYRKTFDDFFLAAKDCDVIVYHPKAFVTPDIAKYLGIPCVSMPPTPITFPIKEFPCIAMSSRKNYGSFINKLSYSFNAKAEAGYIKEINEFRKQSLGLEARKSGQCTYSIDHYKIPIIYPISKHLFQDVTSWNGHVYLSGFFFLQSKAQLTGAIEAFLQEGKAPVVISFSSMPLSNPRGFVEKLNYALEKTDNRAILLVGNSGIDVSDSPRVLVANQAPHTLLFSRAKAIIHHGGAGTTAAALASGVPQLIMPFALDQPFWAERVYQAGASLRSIKEEELSGESLSMLLDQLETEEICQKAKELGQKIEQEDGLQRAVDYILNLKRDENCL